MLDKMIERLLARRGFDHCTNRTASIAPEAMRAILSAA